MPINYYPVQQGARPAIIVGYRQTKHRNLSRDVLKHFRVNDLLPIECCRTIRFRGSCLRVDSFLHGFMDQNSTVSCERDVASLAEIPPGRVFLKSESSPNSELKGVHTPSLSDPCAVGRLVRCKHRQYFQDPPSLLDVQLIPDVGSAVPSIPCVLNS